MTDERPSEGSDGMVDADDKLDRLLDAAPSDPSASSERPPFELEIMSTHLNAEKTESMHRAMAESSEGSDGPWHADVPWHRLKALYRKMRYRFFRVSRPSGTYFRVQPPNIDAEADVAFEANRRRLFREMGGLSFAPNWEYSYHKQGEILNLARVVYSEEEEYPDLRWWQYHYRGWRAPNGCIDLGGHWETEPTEHPEAHLNEVGFDGLRGMSKLEEVLNNIGVEYREVQYDG